MHSHPSTDPSRSDPTTSSTQPADGAIAQPHHAARSEDAAVDRRGLLGLAGLAGVAGMAMLAGKTSAGPLTPPAGPITSTGKTLTEVEPRFAISTLPFSIVTPGSYYLTGNLQVAATTGNLIAIFVDNVTIDLNGYTISGGQTGIFSSNTFQNVTIRNGTIRNTSGSGIFLPNVKRATISDLNIDQQTDAGIFVGGQGIIQRVVVTSSPTSTTSSGISVSFDSRLTDCAVLGCALKGISAAAGSVVDRCSVNAAGTDGITLGSTSQLLRSLINNSGARGVVLEQYCSVNQVDVIGGTTGFSSQYGCTFLAATAKSVAGDGFVFLQAFNSLQDCHVVLVEGNAYLAQIGGFGHVFERCSARDVALNGFQLTGGCSVKECMVISTGTFSTLGTVLSSGVLFNGDDNVVQNCRFVACGYPTFIPTSRVRNAIFGNVAMSCANTYINNGGASNVVGTIRTGTAPINATDNFFVA